MVHILAQNENGPLDVLLWLVPVAIWVIGSIAATMNKKKEQERRKRVRDQINPMPPPAPPPAPPAQYREQQPLPVPAPQRRQPPLGKRDPKRFAVKPPRLPARPPPAEIARVEPTELPEPPRRIAPAASPAARPRPAAVNARVIHQWLTPATLQQQFILTELLQPPMALREPREL